MSEKEWVKKSKREREWKRVRNEENAVSCVHENDYELFYGVFKCLYVICARNKANTQIT